MKKAVAKIFFCGLLFFLTNNNYALTYTVTNTNDAGLGSFRQAIMDANANATLDNIVFNIGSGSQTITLLSVVSLTTPAFIDGSSQPGFSGTQLISIAGVSKFQITLTGTTTVQWLDFSGNTGSTCILLNSVSNCTITNNNLSNVANGLRFVGSLTNNVITNNIINSTTSNGIFMNGIDVGSVINNNTIMNSSLVAINFASGGTPASITGNTLTGSTHALALKQVTNFTVSGSSGPNVNVYGNHPTKTLSLAQCTAVVVSNFNFGPTVTPPLNTHNPFLVSGCSNCLFNNVSAVGMSTGIEIGGYNTTNTITNCNFSNAAYRGINMSGATNIAWMIDNNNLTNCITALYYEGGTPASIKSNTFTGSGNAIMLRTVNNFTIDPPGGPGPNSNIMGGHTNSVLNFDNCNSINISNWNFPAVTAPPLNTRTPLYVYLSQNCLFNNNIITGMYTAMQFTQSNMSHTITNNDVSGAMFVGVQIMGGSSQNLVINNNNMTNCGFGLWYSGGIPTSINSNTFTGSARAIELDGINNFTLSPPGGPGPNTNVYGNHTLAIITLSGCNGINISNWNFVPITASPLNIRTPLEVYKSTNCVFNNNNLSGMKTGILFGSATPNNSGHTITNSNMSGATDYGICIFTNSANTGGFTINNNDLSNCGNIALRAPGSHASISNNTLTGSVNGMWLSSTNNFTLGPNTFGNQTGNSIHLFYCNGITIPNTVTGGAGGTGIFLDGCNNSVISNNMSCGRQYGIRVSVNSGNNSISTSSIGNCSIAGIKLDPNSFTTTINGVSFNNNSADIINNGVNTIISGTTTGNFAPIVTVNSGSICAGQSFTMIPSGGLSYSYIGGGPVVSPSITSTYSVVGTSTSGCVGSAISTVNVASPTITVNSGSVCAGDSFTIVPSGANSYTIEGGSFVVTPSVSTSYTINGTGTNGCISPVTFTSNITVNALPNISVNSGTICTGQSFTMIPGGANTYTFEGGSSIVSPTVNTNYTVTGTSIQGCPSSSFATSYVNFNNTAAPNITVNSGSVCVGKSFTINPGGANTYTVQGGASIVSPGISSTYTVVGTAANGCISSSFATSTVTVLPNPIIIVNTGSICAGNSFTITPSGASTYTLQGGNAVVSPTVNSSFTVVGTSTAGCVSTTPSTCFVTVKPGPTISVNSGSICSGQSFTLLPNGANTYTFQGGNAVVSPTVNSSYTVVGTSTAGCVSQTFATSTITVNATPTISVNNGSLCIGESFTIIPSGANNYTYSGGSAIVSPTTNSTYTVTGTLNGCMGQAVQSITVLGLPVIITSATPTFICAGQTSTVNVTGALNYSWSPAIPLNGIVSPTNTITYSVTGTDANNCTSTQAAITVSVDVCTNALAVSNAKTLIHVYPNPTGDKFTIELIKASEIEIYTSLGQIIYREKHPELRYEISLENFTKGIYFIKAGATMQKIIKE